jgi:hypothetical protein
MLHHSLKFMENSCIAHEDVRMTTFASTLEDKALEWYDNLGEKEISSLADLLKLFLKHWDPHYEEEYEIIIARFLAVLHKEHIDEKSSHDPMEDQAHEEPCHVPIEDQEPPHDSIKEDFDEGLGGESIQASVFS